MSASINKAIVIGTLGRDPETRFLQSGAQVCTLNVATNHRWKNKQSGEWNEETEWHKITVWGKTAEACGNYLRKGRQVYVEGRLKTTSYEKDGVKKYTTEIVADTVQFLGGKEQSSQGQGTSDCNRDPDPRDAAMQDDIPF
jgi:single-strand DNA-binding protein